MTFTILVDPSLVIITILLVYVNHAGSTEEDFSKNTVINFTLFTPELHPLGVGAQILQFLVSLPNRCYIPNLVKIGPVALEEMLRDDANP